MDEHRTRYSEDVRYDEQLGWLNMKYLEACIYGSADDMYTTVRTLYSFLIPDVLRHCEKQCDEIITKADLRYNELKVDMRHTAPLKFSATEQKIRELKRETATELHRFIMYALEKENLLLKRHDVATGVAPSAQLLRMEDPDEE